MKLHNLKIKALGIALMALLPAAQAFVIMGQPNAGEAAVWNYTDDLGAPAPGRCTESGIGGCDRQSGFLTVQNHTCRASSRS